MRKLHQIRTNSGSLYLISESEEGLAINQEGKINNPHRWQGQDWDSWQPCTISPWPPAVGDSMNIIRPKVPFGQGRLTVTSAVMEIKTGEPCKE